QDFEIIHKPYDIAEETMEINDNSFQQLDIKNVDLTIEKKHLETIQSPEIKNKMRMLLKQHNSIIAKHRYDAGVLPNVEMEIKLKPNTTPFYSKPYRLPVHQTKDM